MDYIIFNPREKRIVPHSAAVLCVLLLKVCFDRQQSELSLCVIHAGHIHPLALTCDSSMSLFFAQS